MPHRDITDFSSARRSIQRALETALREEAASRELALNAQDSALLARTAAEVDRQLDADARDTGLAECDAALRKLFATPPLALLIFDTPGIQDYLFRVTSPVLLFGGSRLVADFTDDRIQGSPAVFHGSKLARGAFFFAGGGSGLIVCAACQADAIAGRLGELLDSPSASELRSIAAYLPIWPLELGAADNPRLPALEAMFGRKVDGEGSRPATRYAASVSALANQLQRARSRDARLPAATPSEQLFALCDTCAAHPAAPGCERRRGDEIERLCRACFARLEYGRRNRRDSQEVWSFEELFDEQNNAKDLAVLYADGANAGQLFGAVDGPARHRLLSEAVELALAAAAQQAGVTEDGADLKRLTVVRGGDDLVVVLPAAGAIEAAARLIESFEQTFDRFARGDAFRNAPTRLKKRMERFGLGVGVAIADLHFPVQFLFEYARELLKSAKKRTRGSEGARSALDYLVLRGGTPLSTSIADFRRRHLRRGDFAFTQRPYSLAELRLLLDKTKVLAEMPKAQVHAIRREVLSHPATSLSLWRYQHARAKDGEGWARLRAEWFRRLGRHRADEHLSQVDQLLWQLQPGDAGEPAHSTDFLDMVEILDFVEGGA